ncbi:hypothetical protein [Micromonospora sp. NPDC126480]|uniref:hypothetical protein n=1 Tax=Micromonospora sp. NPDC126480 TaxID=3155312 RepID=UPI0033278962
MALTEMEENHVAHEVTISFRLPAGLEPSEVKETLFADGSGLQPADRAAQGLDELHFEFDLLVALGALVLSAVDAAASLCELVDRVRNRRSGKPGHEPAKVEINITVNNVNYNLGQLTEEQIRRILER